MNRSLSRRAVAEFTGTLFLVATVVGSGVMAERLANGDVALALLANTMATGAALVELIFTLGGISGAHLNPVVTVMDALERGLPWRETPHYVASQLLGGITGAVVAHLMFGLPPISFSHHARGGGSKVFSEFVATFGLMCDLGLLAFELQRGSVRGRRVHHRRLLVYGFDVIRKSSCDYRALA